jgi:hypothetical protein
MLGSASEAKEVIGPLRNERYTQLNILTAYGWLTDKGKRLAWQELEKRRYKPAPTTFVAHWSDHDSVTENFLVWAWSRHRDDITKGVDLREFCVNQAYGIYEANAVSETLIAHGHMKWAAGAATINRHAEWF